MLPPIPPSTLTSNPRFANLYKKITEDGLNADGSTRRSGKDEKMIKELRESLQKTRLLVYKRKIILQTLVLIGDGAADDIFSKSSPDNTISDEFRETTTLLPALLTKPTHLTNPTLLPLLDTLLTSLPQLSNAVSELLIKQLISLQAIAPRGRELPLSTSPTNGDGEEQEVELKTIMKASTVLQTQAKVLEKSVELLEREVLGTRARGLRARLAWVERRSEVLVVGVKTTMQTTTTNLYTPSTLSALRSYARHLLHHYRLLEDREHVAKTALAGYTGTTTTTQPNNNNEKDSNGGSRLEVEEEDWDSGSGRVSRGGGRRGDKGEMVQIVERYVGLKREIEIVKEDVGRLRKGVRFD
ncbi:MAG: hypothetical protein M1834_003173 [Cirrosporium novae-zelandiae]|nr:MAG: hypothetical protein M1834_003173 [Cirrosporium novae-zelandiae]